MYDNDFLRLYDGNSSGTVLLAELSGLDQIPEDVSSCGHQMILVFSSDGISNGYGYNATIHVSEGNCHTQTTSSSTTFSSTISSYGCYTQSWQGDGSCDDENNKASCDYDGGDCCGDNVDTTYCTQCLCLDPSFQSSTNPSTTGCSNPNWQGDGYCDDENNNANCAYDGGDCCGNNTNVEYCTHCHCLDPSFQTTTFQARIQSSGCYFPDWQGDGYCDDDNNNADCAYDGGDCCGDDFKIDYCTQCQCLDPGYGTTTLPPPTTPAMDPMLCPGYSLIGNDICEDANNNLICHYDGGDCTQERVYNNCLTFDCIDKQKFDPCPNYHQIGDGQCNEENFNLICSFDGGDCQVG